MLIAKGGVEGLVLVMLRVLVMPVSPSVAISDQDDDP